MLGYQIFIKLGNKKYRLNINIVKSWQVNYQI